MLNKIVAAASALALLALPSASLAEDVDPSNWPAIVEAAKGQEVYFNAWGGAPNINAYIAWVGDQVQDKYDVTLNHVKLDDTANA